MKRGRRKRNKLERGNPHLEFLFSKRLLNSKFSQAQIITVILIVLIVIVSFLVVLNVIRPLVKKVSEGMFLEQLADLEIESAYITENNQTIYVAVHRGTDNVNMIALKFVFTDSKGKNYIYKYPVPEGMPDELETKIYKIPAEGVRNQNLDFPDFDFSDIVSVGIAFVVKTSSGKEITSPIKDEFLKEKGDDLRKDVGLIERVDGNAIYCGNTVCETGETADNCLSDCPYCDYYASPDGSGEMCSREDPCNISESWNYVQPGKILCLLDAVYTGKGFMIKPPFGLSGIEQNPITVRALNDGRAYINGEDKNIPIWLSYNNWFIIEGLNAYNSSSTVVVLHKSNHNIIRGVMAWDAKDAYKYIFMVESSNHNLIEDCAGWGYADKTFDSNGGSNNIFRRCFGRWEGCHTVSPKMTFAITYRTHNNTYENCIGTWDGIKMKETYIGMDQQGEGPYGWMRLKVYCSDPSATSVFVSVSGGFLYLNAEGGNAWSGRFNLNDPTIPTLSELVQEINAKQGWTAYFTNPDLSSIPTSQILDMPETNCLGEQNQQWIKFYRIYTNYAVDQPVGMFGVDANKNKNANNSMLGCISYSEQGQRVSNMWGFFSIRLNQMKIENSVSYTENNIYPLRLGSFSKWEQNKEYPNDITHKRSNAVIPTDFTSGGHWYACLQAGKSGGEKPLWPEQEGETIEDGTVIWLDKGPVQLELINTTTIRKSENAPNVIDELWNLENLYEFTDLSAGSYSSIFTERGTDICYRYKNGQLTDKPLWPWPMEKRIWDAMTYSGYDNINGEDKRINVTKDIENIFGAIPNECKSV